MEFKGQESLGELEKRIKVKIPWWATLNAVSTHSNGNAFSVSIEWHFFVLNRVSKFKIEFPITSRDYVLLFTIPPEGGEELLVKVEPEVDVIAGCLARNIKLFEISYLGNP